jgi:hypothetical protein
MAQLDHLVARFNRLGAVKPVKPVEESNVGKDQSFVLVPQSGSSTPISFLFYEHSRQVKIIRTSCMWTKESVCEKKRKERKKERYMDESA